MTSATPTPQLLLDDGTGTYPTDVTSRLSMVQISTQGHGRTDEFSQAGATSLTLTLKNDDGGLSVGTGGTGFGLGGFGTGGFGGGGTGPIVAPGQGIRYKETLGATTVTAFTGKISELPLAWNGGPAKSSSITLTAVDPLALLANRQLRSMPEQEVLLRNVGGFYTLGEAEGSTTAGDTSGKSEPALKLTGVDQTGFTLGTSLGIGDFTGATFVGHGPANSASLHANGGAFTSSSICYTFVVSCASPGGPIGQDWRPVVIGGGGPRIDTTGAVEWQGALSSSITNGLPHVVSVQAGAGGTSDIWVDGVKVATAAPVSSTWGTNTSFGASVTGNTVAGVSSVVGFVSFGSRVPDADVSAIHQSLLNGLAGETTAARFARIASYVGATVSTPINSGQPMGAQATAGNSALDALQAVALAEGGVMFANGSGTLVLQGKGYRAQKITPTLTVPMKDVSVSTTITLDTQQLVNQVTATRINGATQLVANQSSINTYGLYAESLDLAVADDGSALSRAQWEVNKHSTPVQRIGSATVNLLTSSIAAQLMQAEIGDRWHLSGMPPQTWAGFGDLTVEGWSSTLSVTSSGAEWSRTFNLLPWSLFQAGIYDDAGSTYDSAIYA